MGLTAGIIGLPNVGKSTLFNAITKSKALSANYPFATIEPNVGFVEVRDKRLERIVEIVKPKSVVYTSFSFTDIAGLVKGASLGEGLGNQFLANIREVDAICHVVRCFADGDVIHVNGVVNPIDDIETINLELTFADLEVIEKRLPKIEKKAQLKVDKDAETEYKILLKAKEALSEGKSLRDVGFSKEETELIKNYNFLTLKPMIYVLNVGEEDISNDSELVKEVLEYAKKTNTETVKISAKIEDEISDDIFISGDASQIRQLVAILLDNACKYAGIADDCDKSGDSEKKVTVTLTSENEKIKLTVHNTGKAIPEEDLPHLFERFYRTDKSRARTDGGYGLGLAIAQTIAKNHRGKITVVSAKNLGTSFTVTLPVAKEKEHA